MKLTKLKIFSIVLISSFSNVYSTTQNVSVSDFMFSPALIFVNIGDTVKWNWVNGSHTTTCDGSTGTFLPTGAPPWDSPLNSSSPMFVYIPTVPGKYLYKCIPHFSSGMAAVMVVSTIGITPIAELVSNFSLSQNYPNPFNPSTKIKFSILVSSEVSLKIFNAIGMEVDEIVSQRMNAGVYEVDWFAEKFTSGIYFYSLNIDGNRIDLKKMILIK